MFHSRTLFSLRSLSLQCSMSAILVIAMLSLTNGGTAFQFQIAKDFRRIFGLPAAARCTQDICRSRRNTANTLTSLEMSTLTAIGEMQDRGTRRGNSLKSGVRSFRAVFLPPGGLPQPSDEKVAPPTRLPGEDVSLWEDRTSSIRSYDPITGGSMATPAELNEKFRPVGLEKHRLVLKPDEQFGSIVRYEAVVEDTLPFHKHAWSVVAQESNYTVPDDDDVRRAMAMTTELAVQRVMYWTRDWGETRRLAFRKAEAYYTGWRNVNHTIREGTLELLLRLRKADIPICLCSEMDRGSLELALGQLGITDIFQHMVTAEDEFDTRAQMFLGAAIKLGRPPQLCAVFDHDPEGITAAHDISARCVALLGLHKAWELQTADLTVPSLDEITTFNIRKLFAAVGEGPLDALLPEVETKAKRTRWKRGYQDPDDPFVYSSR